VIGNGCAISVIKMAGMRMQLEANHASFAHTEFSFQLFLLVTVPTILVRTDTEKWHHSFW
jgi:hypothetical protein